MVNRTTSRERTYLAVSSRRLRYLLPLHFLSEDQQVYVENHPYNNYHCCCCYSCEVYRGDPCYSPSLIFFFCFCLPLQVSITCPHQLHPDESLLSPTNLCPARHHPCLLTHSLPRLRLHMIYDIGKVIGGSPNIPVYEIYTLIYIYMITIKIRVLKKIPCRINN